MVPLTAAALLTTWERAVRQDPVERALTLLTAVRAADGDDAAVDVGTRDVLLARLLLAVAGPTVWALARCGSCAEPLDVPVDIAAVARLPVHQPQTRFSTTVEGRTVGFRLPTTEDLLAVRATEPETAHRRLLARCLEADDLPPGVADAVDAALEELAPAGAVELVITCPGCGLDTRAALDVAALLWADLELRVADLLDEVHRLATAYGWSEAEILTLSPPRRAAYLELTEP